MDVKLFDITAQQATEIVNDLKKMGLVLHEDFEFAYVPPKYDNFSYEGVERKHTRFTFRDEKFATMFSLRHGHRTGQ